MKPCLRNRKRIALLALDALDARKAVALRGHLALCEDCRRYWEEISTVTKNLAASEPRSNLEASSFFHHAMSEKLQAAQSSSVLENLAGWSRGLTLNWRVALPAATALVIGLLIIVAMRHDSAPGRPASRMDQAASNSGGDPAPTIANYRIIAGQSLQKLDELLTRQGNKPLPPAPIYTASGLVLANTPF
jgi:hypothetical protein